MLTLLRPDAERFPGVSRLEAGMWLAAMAENAVLGTARARRASVRLAGEQITLDQDAASSTAARHTAGR